MKILQYYCSALENEFGSKFRMFVFHAYSVKIKQTMSKVTGQAGSPNGLAIFLGPASC